MVLKGKGERKGLITVQSKDLFSDEQAIKLHQWVVPSQGDFCCGTKWKEERWSCLAPFCYALPPVPPLRFPGAQTHLRNTFLLPPLPWLLQPCLLVSLWDPTSLAACLLAAVAPYEGTDKGNCRGGRRWEKFRLKFESRAELQKQQASSRM